MDQQQYSQPPVAPPQTPHQSPAPQMPPGEERKSSVGPIVGSIIVVLVIVLGGLYLYGSKASAPSDTASYSQEVENIVAAPDESAAALGEQGATDATAEIEADLSSTELDNLDEELGNFDTELNI